MGTRGIYGFRLNDTDYLTYNHYDSYPEYLGNHITKALREYFKKDGTIEELRAKVSSMRIIKDESEIPSEEDKERFKELWSNVSTGQDWYSYLRGLQGDIMGHIKYGIMSVADNFILDSLFCEWGYIVNLDTEILEVYKGFQDAPHNMGRYSDYVPDEGRISTYYACALIAEYPLKDLPKTLSKKLDKRLHELYPDEYEEEVA